MVEKGKTFGFLKHLSCKGKYPGLMISYTLVWSLLNPGTSISAWSQAGSNWNILGQFEEFNSLWCLNVNLIICPYQREFSAFYVKFMMFNI